MHKTFNVLIAGLIILIIGGGVYAKVNLDFNGDMQYRIRYHWVTQRDTAGTKISTAPDLTNRYAWNLKCKATVNENLLFGIRLSNPSGYATDNIADNIEWVTKGNYNLLTIPELYFKWSVGTFALSAGIIRVTPNSVLNLIAYEHNNYLGAGISPWSVLLNSSQKGLEFAFGLVDNETMSLGMNLVAAMADDAAGTDTADAFIHDQIRLILSFPATLLDKKLSLLPVMHVKFNNFRTNDTTLDEASHTIAGGLDVNTNFTDKLSILLGAAGGLFNNKCQEDDSVENDQGVVEPVTQIAPLGMLFHLGLQNKDNFGKAMIDFKFGRSRDREASPTINNNLLFWDIKYAMPIKSLVIMPRVRIWHFPKDKDETDDSESRARLELILKAGF